MPSRAAPSTPLRVLPDTPLDPKLTVHEVAELFRVKPRTVWRWASSGVIPKPHRVGGRLARWRRSEIAAALAA